MDYIQQIKNIATLSHNRGHNKIIIKDWFEAAKLLQQQSTSIIINNNNNNNSMNSNRILSLKKLYHPRTFSNQQAQQQFEKSFKNLFYIPIILTKRPNNIRGLLMPSMIALAVGNMDPGDFEVDVSAQIILTWPL